MAWVATSCDGRRADRSCMGMGRTLRLTNLIATVISTAMVDWLSSLNWALISSTLFGVLLLYCFGSAKDRGFRWTGLISSKFAATPWGQLIDGIAFVIFGTVFTMLVFEPSSYKQAVMSGIGFTGTIAVVLRGQGHG